MRVPIYIFALSVGLLMGCAGSGNLATSPSPTPDLKTGTEATGAAKPNRFLLGMWSVEVSDDHKSVEVTPAREAEMHLNAVKALEVSPCTNCLKISNVVIQSSNEIWLDLTIKHPFKTNLNFTVFDPRAIFISDADYTVIDLPMERTLALGDSLPRLLNYDGYTYLYNPTMYPQSGGNPPEFTYYKGKYANSGGPTAILNPYIAYAKANPRRLFTPGSTETETVKLHVPTGGFKFGYAVDCSWANPGKKVIDPVSDFPIDANSIEPYMISVSITSNLYARHGKSAGLMVDVLDHRNQNYISSVSVYAPDLFTGSKWTYFIYKSGTDTYRYDGYIENDRSPDPGTYPVFIQAIAIDDDPYFGNIESWQLTWVEVKPLTPPVAKAKAGPIPQNAGQSVYFTDDGSYDPDGGGIKLYEWDWDNDGTFDEVSQYNSYAFHTFDSPGTYYVQYRVTDDDNATDELDTPLVITITGNANKFNPVDVTPEWMTLKNSPQCACVDGNYTYVGYSLSESDHGVDISDATDPSNPRWLRRIALPNSPDKMAVSGGYLYVAGGGLQIIDIDPVETASIVKSLDFPNPAIGIAIEGDYAYVVLWNKGLCIVDITVPESASVVNTVDISGYTFDLAVENGYAYVADIGQDVKVVDVDPPESASVVNTFASGLYVQQVAVQGTWAYVNAADDGLLIADISTPETASVIKTLTDVGMACWIAIHGNSAYVGSLGPSTLTLVDISDPPNASVVDSIGMELYGFIVPNNGYIYTKVGNSLGVFDLDPFDSAYLLRTTGFSGPGSMAMDGNHIYMSDLNVGAQILDVWQPESPKIERTVAAGAEGALAYDNGVACLSSYDYPLTILSVDPPASAQVLNALGQDKGRLSKSMRIQNGYAYGLVEYDDLIVYDIDPPESANQVVNFYDNDSEFGAFTMIPGYALITEVTYSGSKYYLAVVDISNPASPTTVNRIAIDSVGTITASGGYAYLADEKGVFRVFDISDPASAHEVGSTQIDAGTSYNIAIDSGYAYVQSNMYTAIIDISNPALPGFVNLIPFYGYSDCGIAVSGQYAYLSENFGNNQWDFRIFKLW